MIDGHLRDRETSRKIGTILRELARLEWGDVTSDDQAAAHLPHQYREIRDLPISQIKEVVRIANDRPGGGSATCNRRARPDPGPSASRCVRSHVSEGGGLAS